jgi:hypothetical protein
MPGVVETSHTFATNEVITSTLMNNIIDETLFTSDALSGGTLALVAGKMKVATSGITSNEVASNAITLNAIADNVITNAKINASAAIDLSKLATGALPTAITVASANIVDGTIVTADIADAAITAPKLNGAQTGTAPIYGVRAWVAFDPNRNAAGSADTLLTARYLISSGNVTSVTKTATGRYTVLITTALPDANYAYFATAQADGSNAPLVYRQNSGTKSTTQFQIETMTRSGSLRDFDEVCISFMR